MNNVCFIINKLTDGGAERVTSVIANCLSKDHNYKVYIVTFEKNIKEYHLNSEITRVNFPVLKSGGIIGMIKSFFYIRRKLLELECDCYIGIDILANLIVSFLALTSNKKTIISERNAPKQVKIRKINRMLRYILYPVADRIVFQTSGAMMDSSKHLQKKGVIIPNPIKQGLPLYDPKIHNICASGRLVEEKNYKMLIDAFSEIIIKHPEYTLSIYGQGILKEDLQDYILSKRLDNSVFLKGYFEDIHNVIKHNEIFVLSSNHEGLPNSLMEAMAMGFPVISTDCPPGGPRSLIEDGINGYLVPVNESAKLSEKLNDLIENPDIRSVFSHNARMVREKYNADVISKKWKILIKEVMK